jgi:hypothetical protein
MKRAMSLFLALIMVVTMMTGVSAFNFGFNADAVIHYNLGSFEVPLEAGDFDGEGHYVIQLEDNAFFPYEVQFRANGETFEEWFMTPQSVIEAGGYTFGVYSGQTDGSLMRQLGFWAEGEYIPAYPEPKEFTNSLFMPLSLFPLPVFYVWADLTEFNHLQLREVEVSAVLNKFPQGEVYNEEVWDEESEEWIEIEYPIIEEDEKVVWMRNIWYRRGNTGQRSSNRYEILEQSDKIDLSFTEELHFIVGSALQLDDTNIRYIVMLEKSDIPVVQSIDIFNESGEVRSPAVFASSFGPFFWRDIPLFTEGYSSHTIATDKPAQDYYVGLTINPVFTAMADEIKVISGYWDVAETALRALELGLAEDLTDIILNQNMTDTGTGFKFTSSPLWRWVNGIDLTIIMFGEDGEVLGLHLEYIFLQRSAPADQPVPAGGLNIFTENEEGERVPAEFFSASPDGSTSTQTTLGRNRTYRSRRRDLTFDAGERDYYIDITINAAFAAYKARVIEGSFNTATAAAAALAEDPEREITETILTDASQVGTGFEFKYIPSATTASRTVSFSIIFYNEDDVPVGLHVEELQFVRLQNGIRHWLMEAERNWIIAISSQTTANQNVTLWLNDDEYKEDEPFTLRMQYTRNGTLNWANRTFVDLAVRGHFDTLEEAQEAIADEESDVEDIKELLFPVNQSTGGITDVFGGDGQQFTVFADDVLYRITVRVTEWPIPPPVPFSWIHFPQPYVPDRFFRMGGALTADDADLYDKLYVMPYWVDVQYDRGFQTVLVNCPEVDLDSIKPSFWNSSGFTVNAPCKDEPGAAVEQISAETTQSFSDGKPVQYTVLDDRRGKNYWVTFVQKVEGRSSLFVNGLNGPACEGTNDCGCKEDEHCRVVFLDRLHDFRHDIFAANVGSLPLTGLNVKLEGARNIALDPYWTFGGTGNDRLRAFTDVETGSYGELWNVGMIRLVQPPEEDRTLDGRISGKLIISADGHEDIVINLTGVAGDPRIVTERTQDGVMFVPYSIVLQTNNMYRDWIPETWRLVSGTVSRPDDDDDDDESVIEPFSAAATGLPPGFVLKPGGEIYGIPLEQGVYTFEVEVRFNTSAAGSGFDFPPDRRQFTIEIKENTDANVNAQNDHEILRRVANINRVYEPQLFEIDHNFADWTGLFFLNGVPLVEGEDYEAEEGSTRITIFGQTFENTSTGTNTIAAEFRDDGGLGVVMTKAAQNFTVTRGGTTGGVNRPGGGSPGGGGAVAAETAGGAGAGTQALAIQPGTGIWVLANIPRTALTALGLSIDIPVTQIRIPAGSMGRRTVNVGEDYTGQITVLTRYNTNTQELEFVSAVTVDEAGNANLNIGLPGDFIALTFRTGDITGTGEVNTTDALALLRHIAGIAELNSIQLFVANGKSGDVSTADALNILRYIAGIIDSI